MITKGDTQKMSEYTKDDIYNMLKDSPQKFNEWKKTQEELDLSEVDFSSLNLEEVDFSDVDLNSSSFADCKLSLVNFTNSDLTSVEFTRANVIECDFTDTILNGSDFSYAVASYCNFTDADMAGCVFQGSDLSNSDFSASFNMNACRFDDETIWPDVDMLPEDFDSTYKDDLSSLKDEEESAPEDY